MKRALAAVILVTTVALAGCGGAGGGAAPRSLGQTDLNPQPRANLRDGGDLRLNLDQYPPNFNYNQTDGTSGALGEIYTAVMPMPFIATADDQYKINPDYLTSASVTSTNPHQVVTFTINPRATWSDGTPITYRDFVALWQAQNGKNPAYQVSGTVGFDDITSVTRGVDDKQVVVTFDKPFGEWETLYSLLTPASLNATPDAFNSSWRNNIPVTAGPFMIQKLDPVAKSVTLARDPKWWGTPPKLDHITMRVIDTSAVADALANNELDEYAIANVDLLRRAQTTPNAVIRSAQGHLSYTITFNGAAGSPLGDLRLRQAVAQSINRQDITRRIVGPIVPTATPNGNHLYPPGSKYYQDNSGVLPYDTAAAGRTLDSLGWVRQGTGPTAPRVKNGQKLTIRLVYYGPDQTNENIVETVQNELAQAGITVTLVQAGGNTLFSDYINPGNFDMGLFLWDTNPTPVSSTSGIYSQPLGDNVRQNYGRIGSPQIDALYAQATTELNDAKRAALGNQIDKLIWQEAHSVVLFTPPGVNAVRKGLANLGSPGFSTPDYINGGFTK